MMQPLYGSMAPLTLATKAPVLSWWLSGGISESNCVAAYAPKGAASQAASYINLANPGTHNAAPGIAPTWDATNGWIFSGTKYLKTGIVPASGYSMIIRFTNSSDSFIAGADQAWTQSGGKFHVRGKYGTSQSDYGNGASTSYNTAYTSGVIAVAGTKGYINSTEVVTIGGWTKPSAGYDIYIGLYHLAASGGSGEGGYFSWNGEIQAMAIYNANISSYIASLTTAINAL